MNECMKCVGKSQREEQCVYEREPRYAPNCSPPEALSDIPALWAACQSSQRPKLCHQNCNKQTSQTENLQSQLFYYHYSNGL